MKKAFLLILMAGLNISTLQIHAMDQGDSKEDAEDRALCTPEQATNELWVALRDRTGSEETWLRHVEKAFARGADMHMRDGAESSLWMALRGDHSSPAVVEALLRRGYSCDHINNESCPPLSGISPLLYVCMKTAYFLSPVKIMKMFLCVGVDIEVRMPVSHRLCQHKTVSELLRIERAKKAFNETLAARAEALEEIKSVEAMASCGKVQRCVQQCLPVTELARMIFHYSLPYCALEGCELLNDVLIAQRWAAMAQKIGVPQQAMQDSAVSQQRTLEERHGIIEPQESVVATQALSSRRIVAADTRLAVAAEQEDVEAEVGVRDSETTMVSSCDQEHLTDQQLAERAARMRDARMNRFGGVENDEKRTK